ncbi:MAG TPA: hypothetical protein VIR58_19990 [Acidimicrobiales bacterium]
MRFTIDLDSDADSRVSGLVATADGSPVPFSGWLQLLRVLEDGTQDNERAQAPASEGLDGQETQWDG